MDVQIANSWKQLLQEEFAKPYFAQLAESVRMEYSAGTVYPNGRDIFRAFDLCDPQDIKIVILGQDPYHGHGQAHGLAFSVPRGVQIPPSLHNIFKEIQQDIGISAPLDGNLERWATQGVFLLNTILTVRRGEPGSHRTIGWQLFTDVVISLISKTSEHACFMLWGSYAQSKAPLIDQGKHLILKAPHPSPFSAHKGFLGCKHFSRANVYLRGRGKTPINW
jgi:uracil-DNA glycosylase